MCSTTYTRGVVVRMDDFINAVRSPKTEAIIARLLTPRTELRYNYTEQCIAAHALTALKAQNHRAITHNTKNKPGCTGCTLLKHAHLQAPEEGLAHESEEAEPAASARFLCRYRKKRRRAGPESIFSWHRRLRAADALQAVEECVTAGLAITDGQEDLDEGGPWRQ